MGLRESLNKNPYLAIGLAAAIILVSAWLMFRGVSGGGGGVAASGEPKRYYTIDDGKTYFADSYHLVPPFEKDGKTAVIARVFRDLDNKGDPFVGYLQRYTAEGKKMIEDQLKAAAGGSAPMEGLAPASEYKRPGEANWIRSTDPRAIPLLNEVKSPKGSLNVEEIYPD